MEIYLFSRPDMAHSPGELRHLTEMLDRHFPGWLVNEAFARKMSELTGIVLPEERTYTAPPLYKEGIAVSYGGDGTLLDCVRMTGGAPVAVLGINSGKLGFLANVPTEGIGQAFEDLAAGRYTTERRPMIQVRGNFPKTPKYPYAFNEFSLQRGGAGMIAVETYVDGEMVATYWGDGAMVSTPGGSTAYSLSVGGPVLVPGCDCFVISPIAPHNLTMRPIVVPNRSEIVMRVRSRHDAPYATFDNQTYPVADGAAFTIKKAKNSTILVKLQNISFYETLRNKMMWGIERREF